MHVAVGNEAGLLLTGRQAAVGAAAAGNAAQKCKLGGPSTAAAAGKRRRPADDGSFELSAKQQKYVSELLEYITIGDQAELVSADSTTPPMTVSEVLMTATAQEGAAEHIVQAAAPIAQLPSPPQEPGASGQPTGQPAVRDDTAVSEGTSLKRQPQRDRWTQARPSLSIMRRKAVSCSLQC